MKERLVEFIEFLKIPVSQFEKKCGLSNGYVNKIRNNLGSKKLSDILTQFPQLNKVWLLTGEGEMLNQNMQIGDGTNIAGDKNSVNESRTVEMFLKEIAAQRRLAEKKDEQIEKKDEQINRLIALLEKCAEK